MRVARHNPLISHPIGSVRRRGVGPAAWSRPLRLAARMTLALAALLVLAMPMPGTARAALTRVGESTDTAPRGATTPEQPAAPGAAGSAGAPVPAGRRATNLAVITITGEINAVTATSVKRRLAKAVDAGADGVVFEIDSPGGEVGAVLEICTQIKQSPLSNSIAWVNPTAYSGGAIIALACREIVLAPAATMGDAAPVAMNPVAFAQGLKDTERQKILAPLLAEVVDSARLHGRDEKLVQAFLTLGVELWLIRERATGEIYFIDAGEYEELFGRSPARGSPHIASGAASGTAPQATEATGQADTLPSSGSERGPGATGFLPASPRVGPETVSSVDSAMTRPSERPSFTARDASRYELVHYATDGQTLLTLKEGDLKLYGLANPDVTIRTDEELKAFVGATHLRRLDQSWSETIVAFMTQGFSGLVVRGVLIIVFLMAMFIEMSVPGVGLPGAIALVALGGLIVPPMLIGAASWWAGAMIVLGVGLIMLELFIFPGFGLPGIAGMVMLLAGLVGTFADVGQLFPGTGPGRGTDLAWALSVVLIAVFLAGTGAYLFTRYTHKFPIAGRLVLADRQIVGDEDEDMLMAMAPVPATEGPVPVGASGRAITPLRPSGTAEINDRLVDVVSDFGFIDAGEPVRVSSVTPYRVGVERDGPPGAAPGSERPAPPGAGGARA